MTEAERNEKIKEYRKLMKWPMEDFESDQMMRRKQPPLAKAPMTDLSSEIKLPRDFSSLELEKDLVKIFALRRSNRVFTKGSISLTELSFLLWSCQGVKSIRGQKYATLRTVPSGGARHPFETYLAVLNVEGLKPGLYHYLPLTHSLELLEERSFATDDERKVLGDSLCEQRWAEKSTVIFYWSIIPYRGEWRYGFDAHRVMLIDAGHVTENLYIAATALGLGTCAIAAVDEEISNGLFSLPGEEEYMFYSSPLGTIDNSNEKEEQEFYAFLSEEEKYYE